MGAPSYKALKKLADVCRKVGIKSFKNAEFEFTLTEEVPLQTSKANKNSIAAMATPPDNRLINEDILTEDQLLFWSAAALDEETKHENN